MSVEYVKVCLFECGVVIRYYFFLKEIVDCIRILVGRLEDIDVVVFVLVLIKF